MITINYLCIMIYIKSDSSFAPIRFVNPVCRSAKCRFSVKIHQPRLQIRRNRFRGVVCHPLSVTLSPSQLDIVTLSA